MKLPQANYEKVSYATLPLGGEKSRQKVLSNSNAPHKKIGNKTVAKHTTRLAEDDYKNDFEVEGPSETTKASVSLPRISNQKPHAKKAPPKAVVSKRAPDSLVQLHTSSTPTLEAEAPSSPLKDQSHECLDQKSLSSNSKPCT